MWQRLDAAVFPPRQTQLDRPVNAQFADPRLQRGALHSKKTGRAAGPRDAPLRMAKRAEYVLAFSFLECRDRSGMRDNQRRLLFGGSGWRVS